MISLLSDTAMTPHGFCLLWDPTLLTWTIIADGSIAFAYLLIPMAIFAEVRKQRLTMPTWVFMMLIAVFLLCGLSHAMMIWTLFQPVYWLETGEKLLTGAVSVFTAALLPFAKPRGTMVVLWWRRARELKHDLNNLRQRHTMLCERFGLPIPVWPDDDTLPPPPNV